MKKNQTYITPNQSQVINKASIWADYEDGLIYPETVNWAYLVGLNVFSHLTDPSDLKLLAAVVTDVEEYIEGSQEDGLIRSLRKSPADFLVYWRKEVEEPHEVYEACHLLADYADPMEFVAERAIQMVPNAPGCSYSH